MSEAKPPVNQAGQTVQGPQTNIFGKVFGPVISGIVHGSVTIVQGIDEKVFRRLGIEQRIEFALLVLIVVGTGVGMYFALRQKEPTQMIGDFRVAVVGFSENDRDRKSALGMQLAQDVYVRLEEEFADMDLDFSVTLWGPDQRWIRGKSRDERAASAETLARKIGADLVVYGVVDTTQTDWVITPEFYVVSENFYEADEVVGQYELGKSFSVLGNRGTLTRTDINDKLSPRVAILSEITVGLARYALRDYSRALETFEHVVGIEESVSGIKEILYLLMGNSAGKMFDLEISEDYHTRALNLDREYARAYVGLADVYYLRSLERFQETKEPTDIDVVWLKTAIDEYQKALTAQNQPALSDIAAKVHFGLGQCYTMLVYAGEDESFDSAIAEFEAVIEDYGQGNNPRLRERAAESRGRLGLIYALSGYEELAIEQYKLAASLLDDNPERQAIYLDRAQKLESAE